VQTILLGDTAIEIPSFLEWRDDDGTLVAYLPETDYANLRFSLLSIKKDGGDVPEAGVQDITRRCKEAGAVLESKNGKVWFYEQTRATEGSDGSVMHYWYVGLDAHLLIVSCFVDAKEAKNPNTVRVLGSVPAAIDSFRKVQDA
jgi:hypothetical protein